MDFFQINGIRTDMADMSFGKIVQVDRHTTRRIAAALSCPAVSLCRTVTGAC